MRRKSFAFLIALIFTFCFSLLLVGCKKDEQPAPSSPESHEEEIVIKEIKIAQPEVTEFSCTGDFISLDLGLTREELAALKIEGGVAVAPGEYTCRITLKDSVHYKLSDDSVTTIEWSIVQALVKKPTIVYDGTGDPRFEYGTVPTLAVEGYTGDALEEYLNRYFTIDGLDVQDVQPTQYNITINIKNGAYFKWDGVEEGHELDPVVISYFVIQKEINLIAPTSKEFTYDGTLKSVISQIPQSIQSLLNIEGGEQTNAGTYTFTATLKNENNYKFSDSSETTFDWTINKATLYKPSIVLETIQYESIPEFTVNGVEDAQAYLNYFTIPELTPQVVANEAYSVDIAITDTNNYKFSDDTDSVTLYYTVVKKEINVATPSLIFTYNGEEQGLDFALDEYLEGIVTLGGELLETNAGGYTATATINDSDNYVLVGEGVNEEGTIKTVVWTINKAPLTKPELVEGDEYHYTYGDLIDLIVDGEDDSETYISTFFDVVRPESNDASDEAYTITITIKSDKTANYKFADNAANVVLTYYIDKVILKLPELEEGEDHHFIYGEDVNIIVPDEDDIETYMATYFDVVRPESDDASDEAYTISITIKAAQSVNFGWPEETENVELTYYIDAREIHVPAPANTEFYYTGEAITLDFGEDIAAYIESGVLSATGITQTDANGFSTTKFVYASNIAPLYFVLDGGNYYLTNSAFDVQGATLLARVTNKNLIFVGETLEYFDQTTNEWKELVADEVEGHFTWTDGEETYYFALVDENYYLTDDTFEIDGLTALTVVTSKQIIYVGENSLEFLDASNNWLVLSTIRDRYNFAIELVDTTNYYLTQNSVIAGSWSISQTTLKLPYLEAGDVHHFIYGEEVVILVDGEDDSASYISNYFDVVRPESNDASDEAYTITITIHDTANYKWPNEQESVVLHYYIDKKAIEIGEPEENEFTYTGSPISLNFGLSAEFVNVLNFEHGTETNSGDYTCVITLVDTTNYYITDGSLLEHNWTINKVVLTKPTLSGSNDQFTYPNVPTLVVNGITDEQMMAYFDDYLTVVVTQGIEVKQSADDDSEEIGYQIAVQNASDTPYTITISIVDAANFCWTTEDADDVTINYTVVKKVIMLTNPTQTEFSYNGEEKIIDLRLSDEVASLVTVEGDSETEAGDDYVCTITINDTTNYIFNDDSTYHEYPWKINRFVTPLTPFFDPEADFNALDWVYSTTLTYTGEEQNLDLRLGGDVLPHVIITTYVRGGSEVVDEVINAGDYTSVITLDGGYAFPYAQNSLTIDWRMEKQTLEKPTILASNQHVGFGNVPTFTVVGQADGNAYVYTYFDVEWPTIANAREEAYPIEITIHDSTNYEWADGASRVVLYYYVDAKEIVISEAPETNAIAYTGERVNLDFGYLGTEYNNVLEFIYTKHDTPSVNYLIYKNGSNFIYFDGTAWRMLVNVSENRYVSVKDLVYLNSGNVEWFDGTTWQSLTQVTGTHYVNMSNLVYDNGASFEWFNGTWHDLINVSGTHYVDKTNLVYENNNTVQYFDGTGWVTLVNVDGTHYINKSNLVVDDGGTIKYFDGTGWKNLIEVAENHYVSATNLIYFNETNYEFFDGTGWVTLVNVDGTHYVNKTNLVLDDSGTIKYFDGTSWISLVEVAENHYLNKTNLVYDNGTTFEYFDGSAWNTLINVGGTHYVNAINLIWNDNGTYKWFDGTAWNALTVDELDSTHFTFDDGENVHYIVIDSEHSSYFVATDDTFETASVNLTVVDSDSAVINFVIDDEHSTYYKTNGDYSETVQEFAKVADKAEVIYFVIDETSEQEAYYISNISYSSTITTLEKVESANEVIYFVIDETPESEAYYIANSEYSQSLTTLTKVLSKAAVMYFVVDDENEDYFVTDSTYTDEVTLLEKVADESAVIYFVINDEFSSYYITDSTYTAQTTPLQKVLDKNEVNYFVLDDEHTSYYISNSDYSQQVSALGKVNAKTDVIYFVIDDENNLFYLTDSNYLNRIAMQTKVNSKANAVTFFIIDEANELYYITSNGTSTDVVLALLFQPGIDPITVGEYDCLVVLKSTGNIPNNYYIGEECLTQFTLTIYQGVLDQPVIDGETNHVTYGEALPALTIEGMESEQAAAYIAEFFDVTYDDDVNAGNHDITVSIKDGHRENRSFGENEQTGEKIYEITIPYVIDRATVNALSSPSELSFTYDGTAKHVNFSDVIGENPYEVTITGATAINAGNYTAVATLGGNWQFDTEVYTQNFNWTINKGTYDGDTTFENYEFRLEVSNSQEAAYVMIELDDSFWQNDDNDWENNTNLNSSNLGQNGMANNNFYGVYVPPKRYFYATEDEELKFYYQDTEKYYLRLCVYDNQAEDYVTHLPAALETSIVLTSVAVGKGSNLTPQDIATTRAELTYIDGVGYMVNLNGIGGCGDRNVQIGVRVSVQDSNHVTKTVDYLFTIKLVWIGPY